MSNNELAENGVKAAERNLKSRGYEIIERNFECRFGSMDIISRDADTWCFIEVKTNDGIEAGLPDEAICKEKMERFERIALDWLMDNDDWEDHDKVRFDTIGICVCAPHRALLRHHKGCFSGLK